MKFKYVLNVLLFMIIIILFFCSINYIFKFTFFETNLLKIYNLNFNKNHKFLSHK